MTSPGKTTIYELHFRQEFRGRSTSRRWAGDPSRGRLKSAPLGATKGDLSPTLAELHAMSLRSCCRLQRHRRLSSTQRCDLAIRLLRRLRGRYADTRYILPARWGKSHAPDHSRCAHSRAGSEITRRVSGCRRFTPHDLRWTAASLMTAHRAPRLHVEEVLNHTIDDVADHL